jgi:hypothetical protein
LSIESYEGTVGPGATFSILVTAGSPGANRCVSSPNDKPHEGQEAASSGISW